MGTCSTARQRVVRAFLAGAFALLPPTFAAAQQQSPPAASAPEKPERFLALDVFGGYAKGPGMSETPGNGEESSETGGDGWDVGATLLYGKRWLGIKATVGRATIVDVPTWQVTAGPQVFIGKAGARWLAHALVGFATTSGTSPSRSSVLWVVGGGVDLFIFRLQGDYLMLSLDGLPRHYGRAFAGVILPLCFRACGDYAENFSSFGR